MSDLDTATEMLALYIQAEKDVLEGKTVQMDGRTMTLEDLSEIRSGRREWERKLISATADANDISTLYATSDFSS